MIHVRAKLVIQLALMSGPAGALAGAQTAPCSVPVNVGLRIVQVPNGPAMAVWYPTTQAEAPYNYASDVAGSVALNGAISTCRSFPFLVFSHAYGGCGYQSLFLTENLARAGYIVAAPDHKDAALCSVNGGSSSLIPTQESFFSPQDWTDQTYIDRWNDLENVMGYILASPDFSPGVDPARIGAVGHSLGGYTVIGLGGGWPSWKDPRVKAVLGLSPYSNPFLVANTLPQIDIPVMLQGAQGDIGVTPFLMGSTGVYGQLQPPKFFLELLGGTHFEWTNLLCLGIPTLAECLATKANASLIVNYSVAYLNLYLNGSDDELSQLNGVGLAAYQRLVPFTSVRAGSYASGASVAPESLVAGFGTPLSMQTVAPTGTVLPSTLANLSVAITDSRGATLNAPLYLVSPGQINYVVPSGVATGQATVTVRLSNQPVATGSVPISTVSPSLFSADGTGAGAAAAEYIRTGPDAIPFGYVFDPVTLQPIPIDLGSEADEVYLMVYGTGLRGETQSIQATIGGTATPVAGPFAHAIFAGLDQVNLGPLPRSLAGRGVLDVVLTVDGQATNPVTVDIQ